MIIHEHKTSTEKLLSELIAESSKRIRVVKQLLKKYDEDNKGGKK